MAVSNMDFFACSARRVMQSIWSPSVAPTVGALGERRGFCASCGARRMAESAALLVDEVLPEQPMRQWVLSFPFQLRFLFASRPEIMGRVLVIVYCVIATHLINKAGHGHATARTGAVTLMIFEPLDFIARLAALVPKPRMNLTRFHGVFAPNSKHRALVTPAKRGTGSHLKVGKMRYRAPRVFVCR